MGEKFKATRDWHLSSAHCAIFCMWPSSTCSQGGCCTFGHHVQEHQEEGGQAGKRQKVPAPESMPFNNFPWKPNLLISYLPEQCHGCIAGRESDLAFHHIKCINPKYTTYGLSQSKHLHLASIRLKKQSGNSLLTTPHILPPSH